MDTVKTIILELPADPKTSRFAEGGLYIDGKLFPIKFMSMNVSPDEQMLVVGIDLSLVTILSTEN